MIIRIEEEKKFSLNFNACQQSFNINLFHSITLLFSNDKENNVILNNKTNTVCSQ